MNVKTIKTIRSAYYIGLGLLVLSVFPWSSGALSSIYSFAITSNITILHALAIGVGLGAAYQFYYKAF